MKWTEIYIKTTEEACDAVSEMLTSIGAAGVAIEDPFEIRRMVESRSPYDYADQDFLDSLGSEVTIKAYFNHQSTPDETVALIREKLRFISNFLDVGRGHVGYAEVNEEDWSTAWKKHYKPFNISGGIVVKPSWEEYIARNGEIVVELDPGMAFGTGTHETTRLCAKMLEKYVKKGDSVIDVGCGTGILSIIAAKLGASRIDAVDIDDVAVEIAKKNCDINGVGDIVNVKKGTLEDLEPWHADIVVANIIADVVAGLSACMTSYLKKGGILVASGIIKDRKDDVVRAYLDKGFMVEEIEEMGEWVAIVFKCPGFS